MRSIEVGRGSKRPLCPRPTSALKRRSSPRRTKTPREAGAFFKRLRYGVTATGSGSGWSRWSAQKR
jgi:hypothetical protein